MGISSFIYFQSILSIKKWEKSIDIYLDSIEKYSLNKIILSENAFSLIQDNEETIEKWSNFNSVTLSDESIILTSNQNYLIPSKSMSKEDLVLAKSIISNKVK